MLGIDDGGISARGAVEFGGGGGGGGGAPR